MNALILMLALSGTSSAFAPTDTVHTGIEPQRVRWMNGPVQAELLASPAFRRFLATDGAGWEARFDEATGTPRWMWGRGIPVDDGSADRVVRSVAAVLGRHEDLLGARDLALRTAHFDPASDTWYLDFDALRDGLPTWRGGISARVKHGNLVALHVATSPAAPVTGAFHLTPSDAVERAIHAGPAPTARHTDVAVAPILLERAGLAGLELVRAFEVRSRTADPPGRWVSFVEAASGRLLSVHNEVRFATGTVSAEHHARVDDGSPLVTSALPLVTVEGELDLDVTDGLGSWSVADSAAYATDLHGEYVDVDNEAGPDAVLASALPDLLWTDASATQAEIDTYVFLHHVKAWGERVAPDNAWTYLPFESKVNLNATCNAYWDGNVNFFVAGDGCNNTGENADVNYHEWGHGFHYFSIQAGIFDGSLSEGASDVVAFLQTGDPLIAPFFGVDGWGIRNVAPDRVYPQDYVNNEYFVHDNGLIFGGAMWDLRELLIDELGETDGIAVTEQIFVGLLKGGTDIPGTYLEALVADDDDGDLANGTPHQCSILEAFGAHGLGGLATGGVALVEHDPLVAVPADVPATVAMTVRSVAPQCVVVTPDEATIHWRADGGDWETVEADIDGDTVEAEVPALPLGTFVEYWIDGIDGEGSPFTAPNSGKVAPFTYFVGDTIEIGCEDFEQDDGGFVHVLLEGDDDEGADDWQWGFPNGQANDPSSAWSGSKVWGNDLGHDNFNGQYQPDKVNRLRSVRLETGHYTDVFLQYRRWLNIEDGFYDQALITANGETVWSNWESDTGEDHTEDRQWVSHSVDLLGLADQGDVQIGWELHSDAGLEFGGWTLDDVCILAPATPDNRLGIVDFTATDDGGPTEVAWTNPIHQPVERVVVVRKVGSWPTSWEDGEIVVDVDAPVAGERVEATHANLDGLAGHYAVYAWDGADWLSWTIEGWNAAFVEASAGLLTGGGTGEGGDAIRGNGAGCGCAGTGTGAMPGALPVIGLSLLAVARRSRRTRA